MSKVKAPASAKRSLCPISSTLDIIGDKWTLLILRDMLFMQKRQFGDFLKSPEKIATNILTNRLGKLTEIGLIEKHAYQNNPPRYEYHLTQAGRSLKPVLFEIMQWGIENVDSVYKPKAETLARVKSA
jgi:DNA-binding HxlR family transcriptional regulator